MPAVLVFGHGAGEQLNSAASFVQVRESGADGVELDVRRTSDDELIAIHDHRLPDGRDVSATASAQIPADIPRLTDVLDICAGLIVNIEVKNYPRDPAFDPTERISDLVVDLLSERGGQDDVIVSSFGLACIDRVRARRPQLATAALLLSRRPAAELLDPVVRSGHRFVHPYDTMVDEQFMAEARARSLAVNVWIGDDVPPARLRQLVDLGVAGIITSSPEAARNA